MNLIGKWKVKELPVYPEPGKMIFVAVEDFPKYITDEDLLNDYMQQASFIYEFCEDGTVETMMPIPEEMMEKAKEQGAKIKGNYGVIDTTVWKEEDGKIFYDTKINGTVMDEPVSSFAEIKEAEELYKKMGQRLCPSKENPCYIISPHEEFEVFFGKKADKKRKLYNGMIKCNLYMYFK